MNEHEVYIRSLLHEQLKLFLGETEQDLTESLYKRLNIIELKTGEALFNQGDTADELYFLVLGKLRAYQNIDGQPHFLGDIFHGESVGEMGFFSKERRSASVKALRHSVVASMPRSVFDEVCLHNHGILNEINKFLIKRLAEANQSKLVETRANDMVVALTCMPGELNKRSHNSVLRLLETGTNCLVLRPSCSEDISKAIFTHEKEYDHCVLSTETCNGLDRPICGASDTLVVFATEEQDVLSHPFLSDLSSSEEQLRTMDRYLVLSYAPQSSPDVPNTWFQYFPPGRILKIRDGHAADYQRVYRTLRGKGIGLALSGGGAHGFAHLGVMKALSEKGIPVDFVCGTSIGAIMGAGLAMDWSLDEILAKVRREISDHNPLNDYSFPFPFTALLKGRRMENRLRKHFNLNTENTWINFMCIASNYQNAKIERLLTGPMYRNISASISIPGILPPKVLNKTYVLDGGVLENVPVNSLRQEFRGKIITVDLSHIKQFEVKETEVAGPVQILFSKLNPFSRTIRYPHLMNVVMKALTLSSVHAQTSSKNASDVYINPRVSKGFLSWKSFDVIVEEGYRSALNELEQIDLEQLLG